MNDIAARQDVELLVREFYKKVRKNETLGYLFDDIVKINWDHHVPILVDFRESILLDTGSYTRNAIGEHFKVNQKIKLEPVHFTTWLSLFDATLMNYSKAKKRTSQKKELIQLVRSCK